MSSRSELDRMKEIIDSMDSSEHTQILEIVRKYTTQYTKTQSGILVSSDVLSPECLAEIKTYITFSLDQRKRMEEDTRTRKTYERMVHE